VLVFYVARTVCAWFYEIVPGRLYLVLLTYEPLAGAIDLV